MRNTQTTESPDVSVNVTDTFDTSDVDTTEAKARKTRVVLTEEDRSAIRELLATGMKQTEIAKQFGVSSPTISNISRNYKTVKPRKSETPKPFVGQ